VQVRRYELESRTKISSVDILVAVGETKVVVEVDGPSHYAANRCADATSLACKLTISISWYHARKPYHYADTAGMASSLAEQAADIAIACNKALISRCRRLQQLRD
jgi:hypothetical protein